LRNTAADDALCSSLTHLMFLVIILFQTRWTMLMVMLLEMRTASTAVTVMKGNMQVMHKIQLQVIAGDALLCTVLFDIC